MFDRCLAPSFEAEVGSRDNMTCIVIALKVWSGVLDLDLRINIADMTEAVAMAVCKHKLLCLHLEVCTCPTASAFGRLLIWPVIYSKPTQSTHSGHCVASSVLDIGVWPPQWQTALNSFCRLSI